MDHSDQQFKRGLLVPGVRVFVRLSLALGRIIVIPYAKILFKLYMNINIQTETYYKILKFIINSLIPNDFSDTPLLFYSPFSFCIYFLSHPWSVTHFPHISHQSSRTLLQPSLFLTQLSTQAMIHFHFPSLCFPSLFSYLRLYTHMWEFGARHLRWERIFHVCLAGSEWSHSMVSIVYLSISWLYLLHLTS